MSCFENTLRPRPRTQLFRVKEILGLLILLLIRAALHAQSDGLGPERSYFNPDAEVTREVGNGAPGKFPAQALRILAYSTFTDLCITTTRCIEEGILSVRSPSIPSWAASEAGRDEPDRETKGSSVAVTRNPKSENQGAYYKNRLEFSLDSGWLPINIPFVFDFLLGDSYNMTPLKYTLVPVIGSIRWQIDDVGGPWILRGNWDLECSGGVTFIPRGPETRYIAWIIGFRRNFVPRRGRVAAYFDGRVGMGDIDAKGPAGVLYAQGQDFTFTLNMGSGVRYNFNSRYSISAGLNWMHISNLYLSQPEFSNYGINVYGPLFGINVALGKSGHRSIQ